LTSWTSIWPRTSTSIASDLVITLAFIEARIICAIVYEILTL
jgi:hypothetical protein